MMKLSSAFVHANRTIEKSKVGARLIFYAPLVDRYSATLVRKQVACDEKEVRETTALQ